MVKEWKIANIWWCYGGKIVKLHQQRQRIPAPTVPRCRCGRLADGICLAVRPRPRVSQIGPLKVSTLSSQGWRAQLAKLPTIAVLRNDNAWFLDLYSWRPLATQEGQARLSGPCDRRVCSQHIFWRCPAASAGLARTSYTKRPAHRPERRVANRPWRQMFLSFLGITMYNIWYKVLYAIYGSSTYETKHFMFHSFTCFFSSTKIIDSRSTPPHLQEIQSPLLRISNQPWKFKLISLLLLLSLQSYSLCTTNYISNIPINFHYTTSFVGQIPTAHYILRT